MLIHAGNRLELFLGAAIGAITFSGSVIAFGKLSGKYKFRLFQGALVFWTTFHKPRSRLSIIVLGVVFTLTENWTAFSCFSAFIYCRVLIIIPIGGADMPVVVSMLNSYSGWAAAGITFPKKQYANCRWLISRFSGAILSYIMCKAMNRAFLSVILGALVAKQI